MQSTRTTTTAPRRLCKAIISPHTAHKRNFGMITTFPTFPSLSSSFFADDITPPIFRILDRPLLHPTFRARRWAQPRHLAAPRFDVRERTAAFELQGELPGLQQKDVTIEFVDQHTLVIRGRVEREETVTNLKESERKGEEEEEEGFVQVDGDDKGEEVQGGDQPSTTAANAANANANENGNVSSDKGKEPATTKTTTAATEEQNEDAETSKYKYWISERAVGTFERHFKFPSDVDQEAVKASLKNGILNVIVPKIVKQQKRIVVEG